MATLKPTTPLQPLMQTNMKPPSPMLTPEQRPLKPTTPLQPKNAPKTPISHPQRRWRFQLGLSLREQRRHRFHARDFRCPWAVAGPGRTTSRRQHTRRRWCEGRRRVRRARLRCPWAAAGPGRASSRHTSTRQHTRSHWCGGRRRGLPRCRWAAAGPGRASRRRAERSSRRGRLAGGPPPTGTHSGRARRRPEHQRRHKHHRTEKPQNSS